MSYTKNAPVKGFVYYAVAIAALGGLLFGYDTGVISGAILFLKVQFHLSPTMEEIVVRRFWWAPSAVLPLGVH